MNSNFSSWQEIIAGVMQGSILGTVLFNVFLNGLFFVPSSKLSNYADDNKSYASGSNLGEIKEVLLNNLKIVLLLK